ncbi:SurA N-terminal domain-containing protein [Balneatrix alpica]|uniref:Periplasmic chaperone PpiD n=1 Tax=Balneatrix alpica TaxID=75684 RepID=A0ABV5Z8H2_9GAMM|nr:SurA N-terminal domain-containing protein [Balneatrix alpica]
MLQNIRDNSSGLVSKILVGLIAITFALWGVDSLFTLSAGSDAPAKVNGEEVSRQALLQTVELQRRQLLNQMGGNIDPALLDDNRLQRQALDRLIEEEVVLQQAAKLGLGVSDELMDQMIVRTPDFHVEGKFDQERFQQVLRNVGLTPLLYRELLRRDLLINQVRSAISASEFMLPQELETLLLLDRQQRDARIQVFKADDYEAQVQLDDAALQAFYQANLNSYRAPEQVVLRYVALRKADLLQEVNVDEAELQTAYQQHLASLQARKQQQVAHILVEVSDEQNEEAAKARIAEVQAKLQAGESFAELASQFSDDASSAEQGGDLGFIEPGLLEPVLDEALAQLEEGAVSAPVRSSFGYHLLTVIKEQEETPPSFADMRAELEQQVKQRQVDTLFVERAEKLADLSFTSPDLQEPADALGLQVEETPAFDRAGGEGIAASQRLLSKVFDPEFIKAGENSEPIEVDADTLVVVRIKEHKPERQLELAEVKDRVQAEARRQEAQKLAAAAAAEQLASVKADASQAAQWPLFEGLTRNAQEQDPQLLQGLFAMPHPQQQPSVAQLTLSNGDQALVQLLKVQPGEVKDLPADQLQSLRGFMASQQGQELFQHFNRELLKKAEIERF